MRMRTNANADQLRAFKVRLYPTDSQRDRLDQILSLSRYAYNWTIETIYNYRKEGKRCPGFFDIDKEFRDYRKAQNFEWLKSLPAGAAGLQVKLATESFSMYFKKYNGKPKFRSRKRPTQSFMTNAARLYVRGQYIKLEGFDRHDLIYAANHNIPKLPKGKSYYKAVVIRDSDMNYWLSVCVERDIKPIRKRKSDPVGIDVGVRTLITTSEGDTYNFPDLTKLEKRKKRQQRKASKDHLKLLAESKRTKTKYHDLPKSKNMLKREAAVRKTYQKIKNIQDTYIHSVTKQIVERNPRAIVLEDINVTKMLSKQNPLSRNLQKDKPQMKFGRIRHCLTYKANDRGIPVIIAPKDYPSTKMCSKCGNIYEIGASKTYKCPKCGLVIDRDLNAAYNLKQLAYQ